MAITYSISVLVLRGAVPEPARGGHNRSFDI
jgi:hypothetical protein